MIELANIKDIKISDKDVFRLYIDDKLVWERNNPHPSPRPEPPTPPPTLPTKLLFEEYTWDFEDAIKSLGGSYKYIDGRDVWSDGNNLYYSKDEYQYVLDETTPIPTWRRKYWNKSFLSINPGGHNVWSDGTNLYYSGASYNRQYKLVGGDWVQTSFNIDVYGEDVWSDGVNTYHSHNYDTHKLVNGQWVKVSELAISYGKFVWSDGENIYHSDSSETYKLVNGHWEQVSEWDGLVLLGDCIFTDGTNIYHSRSSSKNRRYVLNKETGIWYDIPMVDTLDDDIRYVDGGSVFYWNGRIYHCYNGVHTITPIS